MVERKRGRTGQVQRRRRLANEPLCRRCKEAGRVTQATVPDHIKPLTKGGTDEDTNIRCLCAECHREVTAEQFGQRRIVGTDADGWPVDRDPARNATNRPRGG